MLQSLAFNLFFILWTLFWGVVLAPALLMGRAAVWRVAWLWSHSVLLALRLFCGVRREVRGREHIYADPVIYAVKHQSAWDIFMLATLLFQPAFVLKRSLLLTPLVGFYLLRAEMIPIDRKGKGRAMMQMMEAAKRAIHQGRPIVIFPEGTRAAPGVEARYHPGVAALYRTLNLPVVPVALNSGNFWGRNAFRKRPGTAVIEFLPPIQPGLAPRTFLDELARRIEPASRKLMAQSRND